jgi:RNA polymerase sigma-70 factor (ECF subfamily)
MDVMEIMIERYKTPLYRFCHHLTSNKYDCEDLFQETWVRVVKNINSFDQDKNFETWLCTIAVNCYKDRYRRSKRWLNRIKDYFTNEDKEQEMENAASLDPSPEEQIVAVEMRESLREQINKLDDIYKLPIILFYFKNMCHNDISEVLGIPVGTVKSRLNTGRSKLKAMMEVNING